MLHERLLSHASRKACASRVKTAGIRRRGSLRAVLDRVDSLRSPPHGDASTGQEFSWSEDEFIDTIVDVKGSAARGAMLRAGTCYMEMFQYSAPSGVSRHPVECMAAQYMCS